MKPLVQGAFAFGTKALTQRCSWGRVISRRSGGTWQRRWPRAKKPGPGDDIEMTREVKGRLRGARPQIVKLGDFSHRSGSVQSIPSMWPDGTASTTGMG